MYNSFLEHAKYKAGLSGPLLDEDCAASVRGSWIKADACHVKGSFMDGVNCEIVPSGVLSHKEGIGAAQGSCFEGGTRPARGTDARGVVVGDNGHYIAAHQ